LEFFIFGYFKLPALFSLVPALSENKKTFQTFDGLFNSLIHFISPRIKNHGRERSWRRGWVLAGPLCTGGGDRRAVEAAARWREADCR
jgi:hypothetical protein